MIQTGKEDDGIYLFTRKPKLNEIMTVVAMEMAARLRSPRWPANAWVMTVMENMARRTRIEGPAICHNFWDSSHVSLIKLPGQLNWRRWFREWVFSRMSESRKGSYSSPIGVPGTGSIMSKSKCGSWCNWNPWAYLGPWAWKNQDDPAQDKATIIMGLTLIKPFSSVIWLIEFHW